MRKPISFRLNQSLEPTAAYLCNARRNIRCQFVFLSLVLLVIGCASTDWSKDAARSAGLSEAEARELIQLASAHYQLPAVGLTKDKEGVVTVLLSGDRKPHGGTAVRFEKVGRKWVEKESGPWWE